MPEKTSDEMNGKPLPRLELKTSGGGSFKLPEDLLGKWTVLYFYPKDDTPGCTRQACSYRDHIADFRSAGIQVLGVSLDDESSHDSFVSKFSLNFPLLADTEKKLSEALGVYGEQTWKDQKYMGLSRDTFLIDPKGNVKQVWRKVNPDATMQETLQAAKSFL